MTSRIVNRALPLRIALAGIGFVAGIGAARAEEPTPRDGGAPDVQGPVAAADMERDRDGGAASGGPDAPPAPHAALPATVPPAPPPAREPRRGLVTPEVDVTGRSPRVLDHVPGSAAVLRRQDLVQLAPQTSGDALRTVAGVNVVSEDGMGLRQNIGLRGLDPNRSRKTLVLEDGLPITLNPYGAPELYYGPAIERMERVEVIKGSGQLLWGPQTVGGLINYVTPDPPKKLSGSAELRGGTFDYLLARVAIGATHGAIGWRADLIHRRFGGARRLDLALTDLSAKLRLALSATSTLTIKLHFYDEASSATYLGPTTPQYQADPTFNPTALHDRMLVRRYAVSAVHQQLFSPHVLLSTAAYAYETEREWRRQDFHRVDMGLDYERICDPLARCGPRGAEGVTPTNDESSLYLLRTAAHRNRHYQVAGIEPRLTWGWAASRVVEGELIALARLHYERAHESVLIGTSPTGQSGDPLDEEVRNGAALALAVQHRFTLWRRLRITPALRIETLWADRHVTRAPPATPQPGVLSVDTDGRGSTFSWAAIPGLGLSFDVADPFTLYAGVHRGYAPPRTKDAVTPTGQNLRLDPELSWNVEVGARLRLGRWLFADVAGFLIEFENQLLPPREDSGQIGSTDVNTGHSRHAGFEASATVDFAALFGRPAFTLPLIASYTWLPAATFIGGLNDGNRLPYAPEHLLSVQVRFVHRAGPSAQVGVTWVGEQFADKGETAPASLNGLYGILPAYATIDARLAFTYARLGLTAFVAGKNLMDQVYIANRAPSGIQAAGFRQLFGGLEWAF